MMIDVPIDERARVTLELWERYAARDAEKAAVLRKARPQAIITLTPNCKGLGVAAQRRL